MSKSMKITRASDYAFRALVYLAANGGGPIETAKIAADICVPPVYLRKIFQTLARAGLVRTSAGSGGGIVLSAAPDSVSLKSIIEALEGEISVSDCIDNANACPRALACKVRKSLEGVQARLKEELAKQRLSNYM